MELIIDFDVEIDRPAQEVFDVIGDARNMPSWASEFEWVEKTSEGPIGKGSTFKGKFNRGDLECDFEFEHYEPGRIVGWHAPPVRRGPGAIESKGMLTLEERDGGVTLHAAWRPELHGSYKIMSPILKRMIKKERGEDLQKLKALVEGTLDETEQTPAKGERGRRGRA